MTLASTPRVRAQLTPRCYLSSNQQEVETSVHQQTQLSLFENLSVKIYLFYNISKFVDLNRTKLFTKK